jgi:hypothetical protein
MVVIARSLVLGSVLIAATVAAAPQPAVACGMYIERMPVRMQPPTAEQLLVRAREKLEKADWRAASRLAQQVVDSRGPRAEQQAEALAMVGWSAWQAGARARAVSSFKQARILDRKGATIEQVLAMVKSPDRVKALRAALEA